MPWACKCRDEGFEIGIGAKLRVERVVVDDVIPVSASGGGFEVRGGVDVGDAEVVQVRDDGRGVLEGEGFVELKPVGGFGAGSGAELREGLVQEFVEDGLGWRHDFSCASGPLERPRPDERAG